MKLKCFIFVDYNYSSAYAIFDNIYPEIQIISSDYIVNDKRSFNIATTKLKNFIAEKDNDYKILIGTIDYELTFNMIKELNLDCEAVSINFIDEIEVKKFIHKISSKIQKINNELMKKRLEIEINNIEDFRLFNLPILTKTLVSCYNLNVGMWGNL